MKNKVWSVWCSIFVFIVLGQLVVGCAGLNPSFDSPKVTLADIQVRNIKTLETSFLVELRVMNPNDTPLTIMGLNCDIELEGNQFASGVQGEERIIEPYSSSLVPVQVYASVLDMVNSVITLLQNANNPGWQPESLEYRLTGKVRVRTNGPPFSVPFTSEGELNLQ